MIYANHIRGLCFEIYESIFVEHGELSKGKSLFKSLEITSKELKVSKNIRLERLTTCFISKPNHPSRGRRISSWKHRIFPRMICMYTRKIDSCNCYGLSRSKILLIEISQKEIEMQIK